MIDLHQHTTFSDGTDTVSELIEKNKKNNIKVMAITDHDNIDNLQYVKSLQKKYGIKLITGVEFSTDFNGDSIHILCYGFNPNDVIVNNLIDKGIKNRHERVSVRLELLKNEFNIELPSDIINKINNNPNPNKPLIANILKDMGYGDNISEIIKKYMYHKLPELKLKAIETIKELSKSSGISVYAHPLGGVGEKRASKELFEERLKSFVNAGLKGLECYYSLYTEEEQNYLVNIAKKYNLLITGGSDYHGKNKEVQIGELSNFGSRPNLNDLTILNKIKFIEI